MPPKTLEDKVKLQGGPAAGSPLAFAEPASGSLLAFDEPAPGSSATVTARSSSSRGDAPSTGCTAELLLRGQGKDIAQCHIPLLLVRLNRFLLTGSMLELGSANMLIDRGLYKVLELHGGAAPILRFPYGEHEARLLRLRLSPDVEAVAQGTALRNYIADLVVRYHAQPSKASVDDFVNEALDYGALGGLYATVHCCATFEPRGASDCVAHCLIAAILAQQLGHASEFVIDAFGYEGHALHHHYLCRAKANSTPSVQSAYGRFRSRVTVAFPGNECAHFFLVDYCSVWAHFFQHQLECNADAAAQAIEYLRWVRHNLLTAIPAVTPIPPPARKHALKTK